MWEHPAWRGEADMLREVAAEHPMGLLLTVGDGRVLATHAPMLWLGDRVVGHLARANTQWRSAVSGHATAAFSNHGLYVSPTVYDDDPAAPTWNYAAVHATGPLRWIHDADESMRILVATIEHLERGRSPRWDHVPSHQRNMGLVPGVVAFEIEVQVVESNLKLGQDETPGRRRDAVAQMYDAGAADHLGSHARWAAELRERGC